jgi:hypothetical protein
MRQRFISLILRRGLTREQAFDLCARPRAAATQPTEPKAPARAGRQRFGVVDAFKVAWGDLDGADETAADRRASRAGATRLGASKPVHPSRAVSADRKR